MTKLMTKAKQGLFDFIVVAVLSFSLILVVSMMLAPIGDRAECGINRTIERTVQMGASEVTEPRHR